MATIKGSKGTIIDTSLGSSDAMASSLAGNTYFIPGMGDYVSALPTSQVSLKAEDLHQKLVAATPFSTHAANAIKGFSAGMVQGFTGQLGTLSPEELIGAAVGNADVWDGALGSWSESMRGIRDWGDQYAKENTPNYVEADPGSFNPLDMGWWSARAGDLGMLGGIMLETGLEAGAIQAATSAMFNPELGVAIEGARAGSKLSKVFETATKMFKASKTSRKAFVGTYAFGKGREALIEAGQTYDDTYNDLISKGVDKNKAKESAAAAATQNFRLNFAVGTMLGALEASVMTYSPLKGMQSEGVIDKALDSITNKPLRNIARSAAEGVSEGIEEGYQQVFQYEGRHTAELMAGLKTDNNFVTDRLPEYLKQADLWNSVAVGFGGGAMFGPAVGAATNAVRNRISGQYNIDKIHDLLRKDIENGIKAEEISKINDALVNGRTNEASLRIRNLTRMNSVHSLYMDYISSREDSLFDDHLDFLERTLATAADDEQGNIIKRTYPKLIDDAKRAKSIFEEEIVGETPTHMLVPLTYNRLELESVKREISENEKFINDNDAVKTNYEISSTGKQLKDMKDIHEGIIAAIDRYEKLLQEPGITVDAAKRILAELRAANSAKAISEDNLSKFEDTRDKKTIDSDNRKIAVEGNQGRVTRAKYINEQLRLVQESLEKEGAAYRDPKLQDRKKSQVYRDRINGAQTVEELEFVRKSIEEEFGVVPEVIDRQIMTKKEDIDKINEAKQQSEIEKAQDKDAEEKIANEQPEVKQTIATEAPVTVDTAAVAARDHAARQIHKIVESSANNELFAGLNVNMLSGISGEGPSFDTDIDSMNSPKDISDLSDDYKYLLGKYMRDYVESSGLENPTFKDIIKQMIDLYGVNKVEELYNGLKEGWTRYTGKDLGTDYFNKVYNELFKRDAAFANLDRLIRSETSIEEQVEHIENQKEAISREEDDGEDIFTESGYVRVFNPTRGSYNGKNAKLSVVGLFSKGTISPEKDNPKYGIAEWELGERSNHGKSQFVNEKSLALPDKFVAGTRLICEIPDNYKEIPYTPRWGDGTKMEIVGTHPTYGDLLKPNGITITVKDHNTLEPTKLHLQVEPNSSKFWQTVPIIAYEKGKTVAEGSSYIHNIEWFTQLTMPNENSRNASMQATLDIREAFAKSKGRIELVVLEKTSGVINNALLKDEKGKSIFKSLKDAHVPFYGIVGKGEINIYMDGKLVKFDDSIGRAVIEDKFFVNKINSVTNSCVRMDFMHYKDGVKHYLITGVMENPNIAPDKEVVDSVVNALKLFAYQNDETKTKEVRNATLKFAELTKYDLSTLDGIEAYFKSYLYTRNIEFVKGQIKVVYNDAKGNRVERTISKGTGKSAAIMNELFAGPNAVIPKILADAKVNVGLNASKINGKSQLYLLDNTWHPRVNDKYTDYADYAMSVLTTSMDNFNVGTTENPVWTPFITPTIKIGLANKNIKEATIEEMVSTQLSVDKQLGVKETPSEVREEIEEALAEKIDRDLDSENIILDAFNALDGLYSLEDRQARSISDILGNINENNSMASPIMNEESYERVIKAGKMLSGILPYEEDTIIQSLFSTINKAVMEKSVNPMTENLDKVVINEFLKLLGNIEEKLTPKLKALNSIDKSKYPNVDLLIHDYNVLFTKIEQLRTKEATDAISENVVNELREVGTITGEEDFESDEDIPYDKDSEESNLSERAGEIVRRFLFSQPDLDENGNQKSGFLGLPLYVDKQTCFTTLIALLADIKNPDFGTMIEVLKEQGSDYPWIWNTINPKNTIVQRLLDSNPEGGKLNHLQNNFAVVMNTHKLGMKFLMVSNVEGQYSLRTYDTNSSTIARSHVNDWQNNIKRLLTEPSGVDSIFNKETARKLLNEFEAFKNRPFAETKDGAKLGDFIISTSEFSESISEGRPFTATSIEDAKYLNSIFGENSSLNVKIGGREYTISKDGDTYTANKYYAISYDRIDDYVNWLSKVGITLSRKTLEKFAKGGLRDIKGNQLYLKDMFDKSRDGIFAYIANRLEHIVNSDKPVLYGSEHGNINFKFNDKIITSVAWQEAKFSLGRMITSWRDGGRTYYGYTATNFATDRINLLKDESFTRDMLNDPYTRNSPTLELLRGGNKSEEFINRYGIFTLGKTALKMRQKRSFSDSSITDLSDGDHELVKIGMMQDMTQGSLPDKPYRVNDINGKEEIFERRFANMFAPTMSDKTKMVVFTTAIYDIQSRHFNIGENGISIGNGINELLYQTVVKPELDRIISYSTDNKNHNINGYDGSIFYLLPEMNNVNIEFNGEKVRLIDYLAKGNDPSVIENQIKVEAYDVLNQFITKVAREKVYSWIKNGIISNNGNYFDGATATSYMSKWGPTFTADETNMLTAYDYVINYLIHNAETSKLYYGDVAFYHKSKVGRGKPISDVSYDDIRQKIKDSYDNANKRMALLIAPGNKISNSFNDRYLQIYLDDNVINAVSYEMYVKALGEKAAMGYLEVTETDAQEYTTWQEHIKVLERYGRVPDSTVDFTPEDMKNAHELFNSGKPLNEFTEKDHILLKKVLQPIKPVYTGREFDAKHMVMRPVYVKSSSFPLIPQLTAGLEIDDLRELMEAAEAKNKMSVRASYQSANKVGAVKNALKIFATDENGKPNGEFKYMNDKSNRRLVNRDPETGNVTIDEDIMYNVVNKHSLVLRRNNFRIQQDVPYKSGKKEYDAISTGTQLNKLILANDVLSLTNFSLDDKKIDGKAIYKIYNDLFEELLKHRYEMLIEQMGTNEDIEKLLTEEAKDAGLFDYAALKLDPDGEFRMPIWFTTNAWKYESLMQSIINKRIIRFKMPGYSYVVGSSAGFTLSSGFESVNESRIVWVNSPIKRLEGRQLLVPSKIRDGNGNLIDLTSDKYSSVIEENGKKFRRLDPTKIDKSLLKLISFRIPTSNHSSMSLDDIVGFLPPEVGDLMIVSPDKATQKGLDFDVDKENTYHFWTHEKEDGTIVPLHYIHNLKDINEELKNATGKRRAELSEIKSKLLNNKMIELNQAILAHPKVEAKTFQILSTDYAKEQANAIYSMNDSTGNVTLSWISDEYQKQSMMNGSSGKAGTGAYSMDLVFHGLIEQIALNNSNDQLQLMETVVDSYGLEQDVPFEIIIDGIKSNGKLGNVRLNKSSRTIPEILGERQNLAVDNATLAVLGKINLGPQTFDVDKVLCLLGYDKGTSVEISNDGKGNVVTVDNIPFLFMSQPIIKDYVEVVKQMSSNISPFARDKNERILQELYSKYPTKTSVSYNDQIFTNEKFVQQIKAKPEEIDNTYQRSVLQLFMKLKEYGEVIREVQTTVNLDSKGVGKSLFSTLDIEEKVNKLTNSKSKLSIRNAVKLIDGALPESYIKYGLTASRELWLRHFPYDSYLVRETFESIKNLSGQKYRMNANTKEDIFTDMKRFIASYKGLGLYDMDVQSERKRIAIDIPGEHKSLASYLQELLAKAPDDSFLKVNPLLRSLEFSIDPTGKGFSIIKYNGAQAAGFNEKGLYRSMQDLLSLNRKLDDFNGEEYDTRKLVHDLVKNAYLEGGVQEASQYVKYIPFEYLDELPLAKVIRNIHKYLLSDKSRNLDSPNNFFGVTYMKEKQISRFGIQYFQHNPEKLQQITNNELLGKSDVKGVNKNTLSFTMSHDWMLDNKFPMMVSIRDTSDFIPGIQSSMPTSRKYFVYILGLNGRYYRIPTLGAFGMNEYVMWNNKIDIYPSLVNTDTNEVDPYIRELFGGNTEVRSDLPTTTPIDDKVLNNEVLPFSSLRHSIILKNIMSHADIDEGLKSYAQLIFENCGDILSNVPIEVNDDSEAEGRFFSGDNRITLSKTYINKSANEGARIYLHEVSHAVFTNVLKKNNIEFTEKGDLVKELDSETTPTHIWEMYSLYKKTKSLLVPKDVREKNAVSNIVEFASEILTNKRLQDKMKTVKYNTNRTLFEKFTDVVKSIFKYINPHTKENVDNITDAALISIISMIKDPVSAIENVNTEGPIASSEENSNEYKIGQYVKFNDEVYIVTKINTNNTIQIYNPTKEGVHSKKSVSSNNLTKMDSSAKVVTHKGNDYLVTSKGTIISLVSNKVMNWGEENGDRKAILSLAEQDQKNISSAETDIRNALSTIRTVDESPDSDILGMAEHGFDPSMMSPADIEEIKKIRKYCD